MHLKIAPRLEGVAPQTNLKIPGLLSCKPSVYYLFIYLSFSPALRFSMNQRLTLQQEKLQLDYDRLKQDEAEKARKLNELR